MQVRNTGFQKSILYKVVRLSNRLEMEAESALKVSFALTFSQFRALEALSASEEITQRQLAALMGVTPAVVSKHAEALADRGLLMQTPNPSSKREKLLKLTEKGERAVADASKEVIRSQQNVLRDIDLQSETALTRALDTLVEA